MPGATAARHDRDGPTIKPFDTNLPSAQNRGWLSTEHARGRRHLAPDPSGATGSRRATAMAEVTDRDGYAEFIRRIRAGDDRAAEELVHRYEPEIRLEIRSRLRLRNPRLRRVFDSMDVCQSVLASFFVRAAVGEFDLDDPRQLVPLLVGIARNKLAERVRYHQRLRRDVRRVDGATPEETDLGAAGESPSQVVSRRELLELVRARLSDDERQVVELRARGLDWADVAGALGGTAEGRRKQLARAVARVGHDLGLGPGAD